MHKCPWCTTNYINWQSTCNQCGGPLAPLPGMGLGPRPPEAPRQVPAQYERRMKWTRNIGTLVGGMFFLVGGIMVIPMLFVAPLAALFPGFFMVGGFFMFRYGWLHAKGVLHAFKHGQAVEGRVAQVSLDTSQAVNNQHPWKLVYHFPIGNQLQEGSVTSFDSTLSSRTPGQPLWVLYNDDDPEKSAIFPPIA
jgi:hypothetical protein